MDQPRVDTFRTERGTRDIDMAGALTLARRAIATVTSAEIDAVARCERGDDGAWSVEIDVIESTARMGDNDLLAAFDIRVAADGTVGSVRRLRKYHREAGCDG